MRSATFPLHRHSFAQVAIDAVLVAAAYFLAYRLRFDFQHVPKHYELLFERTIAWAVVSSVVIFALFGLYQKWWRYVGQRDYVSIIEAVVVATLSIAAFAVITHPVLRPTSSQRGVSTLYVYAPTSGTAPAGVKPALATTLPGIDGDGRVYTMTLRPGATFSDDKPVRASDFRYSIQRRIRQGGPAARVYTNNVAGAAAFARREANGISGIRVNDATGLIAITLVKRDPAFERSLASPASRIVPAGTPVTSNLSNPPPQVVSQVATGTVDVNVPTGVLALFFLLTLGVRRRRALRRAHDLRAPAAAASARARTRAGCSSSAPATAAGSSCARSCATATWRSTRSASSTTTRPSTACASTACASLGPHRRAGAHPRRGRARRGHDRDPVGAGHAARRASCRPAARAASRSARCRRSSSCCRPAAPRQRRAPGARRSRSRTSSAASRSAWSSTASGAYLTGEIVMVTGAGGSIGSELCRQISRVAPRKLILLDHAEDNLFRIQRELEDDRHVHPSSLAVVLADCKEGERMREVFAEHRPTVVFHAAAYKHVGLMELNPVEAVRNNALATRLMARVAGEHERQAVRARSRPTRPSRPRRSWARRRRWPSARSRPPSARWPRHALRDRALRQRARLVGLGRADLPPPDRARRAVDGHRPSG